MLVFIWQISDISYTRYTPLCFIRDQVADRSISAALDVLISCNNSIFLFSVSSYWFDVPKPLYRTLVICSFSRSLVVFSFTGFYPLRCFTLIRLLISRASCTNNPSSIRHCSVFTPCEGIPLSTICPKSPRGFDCAVLFVCLLIFRRLTDGGPIAAIGDTVLQISYSPPFATYTTNQFSNIMLLGFPRNANIIANVEIVPRTGGKYRLALGGGCLSVPPRTSTPRESRHSSTAPIRLIRAIKGFLALCGSVDDRL